MSTAQFIPNFQNFAEALNSGRYIFDIIDRVSRILFNYKSVMQILLVYQQTKIDAMSNEGDKPQMTLNSIVLFSLILLDKKHP